VSCHSFSVSVLVWIFAVSISVEEQYRYGWAMDLRQASYFVLTAPLTVSNIALYGVPYGKQQYKRANFIDNINIDVY